MFSWRKGIRKGIWEDIPKDDLGKIEETIGHRFRDRNILCEAISHPSIRTDGELPTYERLAWLGDAALYEMVSEHVFETYPFVTTGELHNLRERFKNNAYLAKIGRDEIGVSGFLLTGKSRLGQQHSDEMIATMVEAIIGAISLESPKKARIFILRYIIKEK